MLEVVLILEYAVTTLLPLNDSLLFDAECRWLKVRVARLQAQMELREARFRQELGDVPHGNVEDLQKQLAWIRQSETELRTDIDIRLEAHRGDPSRPQLNLDRLCHRHRLNDMERLLVTAACLPAISATLGEDVLGTMASLYGAITIEDLAKLLDPTTPSEWVAAMRLLSPKSVLVESGALAVDHSPTDSPKFEWKESAVYPSSRTLELVTGQHPEPLVAPANDETVQ